MAQRCKKCGTTNPDYANYCAKCGTVFPFSEKEVVRKGTFKALVSLESKYINNPSLGTGFSVLWSAFKRLFSRLWHRIGEEVTSTLVAILSGAIFIAVIWGVTRWMDRNSIDKYSILSDEGGYALFKKGEQLTPFQYDTLVFHHKASNQLSYVIALSGGKYGRLDCRGQVLDSCIYEAISDFKQGWALTQSNGLYGFIKEKKRGENHDIKPKFPMASYFNEGFAWVKFQDNTFGWIDMDGHEVPWGHVFQCGEYRDGWAWTSVDKEGKEYGFVDKKGNVVNLFASGIIAFEEGRAFITQGKGWAMLDTNLSQLTDFVLYPRKDPATKKQTRPLFPYEKEDQRWLCSFNGADCYVNKEGMITEATKMDSSQ